MLPNRGKLPGRNAAGGGGKSDASERRGESAYRSKLTDAGRRPLSARETKQPVAGEWVEKLRVADQRAREGAAYCWENACSVEAINMGDKFWAIHCDIIAVLEGAAAADSVKARDVGSARVRVQRVVSFLRRLRGRWRLWWGLCPACNSDAPEIDSCQVCFAYRTSTTYHPPSAWVLLCWRRRWERLEAETPSAEICGDAGTARGPQD